MQTSSDNQKKKKKENDNRKSIVFVRTIILGCEYIPELSCHETDINEVAQKLTIAEQCYGWSVRLEEGVCVSPSSATLCQRWCSMIHGRVCVCGTEAGRWMRDAVISGMLQISLC